MENKHQTQEVDLGSLELRYAHSRVAKPKLLDMITNSIERFGQISPVLAIPQEKRLVLIDGYLRLQAVKRLGRDTIRVDIHEISEQHALFHLLGGTQQRQWESVEQAWIIRDLKERFGCSLREIARGIGYDTSWVARRLSLIDGLPEDILRSVCTGKVSTYAATRVLVPLARANTDHAAKLVSHLVHHPLSTRELSGFFKHYESSNKQTRERMISDPSLFVKATKTKQDHTTADVLHEGPEGAWIRDLAIVTNVLRRMVRRLPTVIYPGQDESDRSRLVRGFTEAHSIIAQIDKKITQESQ